mgnify:CR=1 FL=1
MEPEKEIDIKVTRPGRVDMVTFSVPASQARGAKAKAALQERAKAVLDGEDDDDVLHVVRVG